MPFPADEPGRVYGAPYAFHTDPVYRTETSLGVAGTVNHDLDHEFIGSVRYNDSYDADGNFGENFGGPWPGLDAAICSWQFTRIGGAISGFWDGTCPTGAVVDGGDRSRNDGSTWATVMEGPSFFPDTSRSVCTIGGWTLWPWTIFSNYTNQWMGDATLGFELVAAVSAAQADAGDGWNVEWEAYHPLFQGFDVAPDETITGPSGTRTEGVYWLYDTDPSSWSFQGLAPTTGDSLWANGAIPSGSTLAHYNGGTAGWVTVPSAWQPTQVDNRFVCSFVEPEDPYAAAVPLTLVSDTLASGVFPGPNVSGGREYQTLVVRAEWKTPRFRLWRESIPAPAPVRVLQRQSDGLVSGGEQTLRRGTITAGLRTIGSQK